MVLPVWLSWQGKYPVVLDRTDGVLSYTYSFLLDETTHSEEKRKDFKALFDRAICSDKTFLSVLLRYIKPHQERTLVRKTGGFQDSQHIQKVGNRATARDDERRIERVFAFEY